MENIFLRKMINKKKLIVFKYQDGAKKISKTYFTWLFRPIHGVFTTYLRLSVYKKRARSL